MSYISGGGGGGSALTVDTIAHILALTPTSGAQAYASDIGVMLIADGSTWNMGSSYFTAQPNKQDIGYAAWSNPIGYGKDYVTNKLIANCQIGYGSSTLPNTLRFDPITGVLQIRFDNAWQNINIGTPLRLNSAYGQQLESQTAAGNWLRYFGDSETLGLNGLPLVQGGEVSMGAYPYPQTMNGGTF